MSTTLITVTDKPNKRKTNFDVEVETADGSSLVVFQGIEAQTKSEAINKAKQKLIYTAERGKV